MGRSGTRLPGFCLNHVATRVRVWFPPPIESKAAVDPGRTPVPPQDNKEKDSSEGGERERRKVMIVVESSGEAKCALQWALSHAVQSNDIVVLLDVAKQSKQANQTQRERDLKDYELLYAMKSICHARRPEVEIEMSLVEGRERGPTIVEEARKQKVSLLVLGQKKRSVTWRLLMLWAGNHRPADGGGVVEYCVQNATCMTLAVRRKSRRGGGYLITSRRHKDFWLLA
ncbi:uncharacterized protein M6B38_365365 [Iris pallida]|uniref:UspA domain-containing protein n=1 Tax=Iris pallida TaxID=29817 RepID=A0AAX6FHN1_IRIPA|nr:uncharacterized protein M6B38_133265 [Iris pallida]KAJ6827858.1 uncharacterized protein M6B38_365365 [Iris pallida]